MKNFALIAAFAALAVPAAAQVDLVPKVDFKLGYGQTQTSVLFVGADITLPISAGIVGRIDADAWSNFDKQHGWALSAPAMFGLNLNLVNFGVGPSLLNYDRGNGGTSKLAGKAFVGTTFAGYRVEADLIATSGYAIGAVTLGFKF